MRYEINIFYLDKFPKECAKQHVDKHVVKMILETCQLLSTAHRVIDGTEIIGVSKSGRKVKRWILQDERENILYSATHVNHPDNIWIRKSYANYMWLWQLLNELSLEYTYRYGKIHMCKQIGLIDCLWNSPKNIVRFLDFNEPPACMPDDCKVGNNVIASYRKYYIDKKSHFAKWTKREIPMWFNT